MTTLLDARDSCGGEAVAPLKTRRWCAACRCPVFAVPGAGCLYCTGALTDDPKRTPRGVERCGRCGDVTPTTRVQDFANGATHLRAECPACGRFIRYVPRGAEPKPTRGDYGTTRGRGASRRRNARAMRVR